MNAKNFENVREIIKFLGRAEIAKAIGVQAKTLTPVVRAGKFPASWYIEVQRLAMNKGAYIPNHFFAMKSAQG